MKCTEEARFLEDTVQHPKRHEFHTALCLVGPSFGGNTLRILNTITEHMATVLKLLTCVVDFPGFNVIRNSHYLEEGFLLFPSVCPDSYRNSTLN